MAKLAGQIRSVLIPITGERVLLPNATVAEVITFANPDPVADSPNWFMGRVVWRGWRVPVFSLSVLGKWAEQESETGAKIAVLKALGGNKDMPFMAMVTQGFPRLVTVGAENLEVVQEAPETDAKAQADGRIEPFSVDMDVEALGANPAPIGEETSAANQEAAGFNPIKAVVAVNGERAVIPDLNAIERRILDAM